MTTFNHLKEDNITEVLSFLTPNRNKEIEDLKEELRMYKGWFEVFPIGVEAIVRHVHYEYRQLNNGVWRRRFNRKKMETPEAEDLGSLRASIVMLEFVRREEAKYVHLKLKKEQKKN